MLAIQILWVCLSPFEQCFSQGSSEKQNPQDIYFKEFSHVTMKAGKSKFADWAGRLETQGRANVAVQAQRHLLVEFPSFPEEVSLCFSKTFN